MGACKEEWVVVGTEGAGATGSRKQVEMGFAEKGTGGEGGRTRGAGKWVDEV